MKIAIISPFYPLRGGIAQFGDSLFLALKNTNDVSAISFKRQYPKLLFPGKTQYVSKEDANRNINAHMIIDSINPLTYYKAAKFIKEFKSEFAIISYWMPFFAPAYGKISSLLKKENIKVIGLLHNVIPHEKRISDKMLAKYFFGKCDGFIILNKNSERDLLAIIPNAKYEVLNHPFYNHYGNKIDREKARERFKIPLDKKVLLFFGFIREYKGLDLLIHSLKYLDDEYILLIAGEDYGDYSNCSKIINELKINDRIKANIRYIPESEIPYFFSASDVCILPYRTATQSGIEGISYHFDLPVIVSQAGGLAENVLENYTGLVIDELHPKNIAKTIEVYFKRSNITAMKENIGKLKAINSWEDFAENICKFYESIKN